MARRFLKTAKLIHSNQFFIIKVVFDFANANGLKTLQRIPFTIIKQLSNNGQKWRILELF